MADMTARYFNPVQVIAGPGALDRLGALVPAASRVLVVTTAGASKRGLTAQTQAALTHCQVSVHDAVTPNPELADMERLAAQHKLAMPTHIVGLGGGSALDAAKILSAALLDARLLGDVLRGGGAWNAALPVIAIPTTAGTGSEVTPFATVWDHQDNRKYSVAGDAVYPQTALLDPRLLLSLPADQTLFTGLDTISHALESLWNRNRSPISAAHAMQALALAVDALPASLARPGDVDARGAMQYASCLAGLAICQTRTAIAHSISYPVTLHFGVPHGLACSFTLTRLLELNLDTLSAMPHERLLLGRVLELLQSLSLAEKIRAFAPPDAILALEAEMHTKGRAENFTGSMGHGIADLISRSLD